MSYIYSVNPRGGDIHDVAPYWFAAFVRFKNRDTFTRSKMASQSASCSTVSNEDGVQEATEVLIADNDCIGWSIRSSKSSHVANCNLTLVAGDTNYVAKLAPGDWMGFWAFDNKQDYLRVKQAVMDKKQANGFLDGFKFLGRVDSVRRTKVRSPLGGLNIQYTVNGLGFSEFDSVIYYNNYFVQKYQNDVLLWMADFGSGSDNLLLGVSSGKGSVQTQDFFPKILRICLGLKSTTNGTDLLNSQVNKGYLVPSTIGSWLNAGKDENGEIKGLLSYVDLLRTYIGVQSYSGGTGDRDNTQLAVNFVPDYASVDQNVYLMKADLTGEFLIKSIDYNNKSIWSILGTYLNEPVDEMYTCMRVDPNGTIMPTLVCRQNPMTTKWFADNNNKDIKVTAFTDLPRWKISKDLITQEDVGRSNSTRFNFVFLLGIDAPGTNTEDNGIVGFVRHPPVVDQADINRSGLRPMYRQINGNVNESKYSKADSPGSNWQEIMADILMGSHLKYSGSITCKGIQEPICEGDNLELDEVLYHIESVTHSGQISPFGSKDFTTTLQLTNGISVTNDTKDTSTTNAELESTNIDQTDPGAATDQGASHVEIVYPEDTDDKVVSATVVEKE